MDSGGRTRWRRPAGAAVVLWTAASMATGACAASSSSTVVAAASSLRAVLPMLVGDDVEVSVAGSQQVIAQVSAGAPIDLAIVVGDAAREALLDTGRVDGEVVAVASNRPAIVVPVGNPQGVASLRDLGRDDLRVALAGAEVPVGAAARRLLASAGVDVTPRIATASAAAVVTAVSLGEADAGIGWRSDAVAGRGRVEIVAIDGDEAVDVYVALIDGHRRSAEGVVRRLTDPASGGVWTAFGFEVVGR